jgi:hypothetical protein
VAGASETSPIELQLRAVELRLERETAVLVDRLNARVEELECAEVELQQTRAELERAEKREAELEAQLDALTIRLASGPRMIRVRRWLEQFRDARR